MRHKKELIENFLDYIVPEPNSGCWLYFGSTSGIKERQCYWRPRYHIPGGSVIASRFAYEAFIGEIPKGKWVLHTCDMKICMNPEHLYIGTREDNVRDMFKRDRFVYGTDVPCHLYSAEDVINMRESFRNGVPFSEILAKYGMAKQYLWKILRNEVRKRG